MCKTVVSSDSTTSDACDNEEKSSNDEQTNDKTVLRHYEYDLNKAKKKMKMKNRESKEVQSYCMKKPYVLFES